MPPRKQRSVKSRRTDPTDVTATYDGFGNGRCRIGGCMQEVHAANHERAREQMRLHQEAKH